jgi:transcriptional regulator with XRE-family HTH domain
MNYKLFGSILGKLLKKREVSLRAFAKEAGVPPSLVSRIIRGEHGIPMARIEPWADFFELNGQERSEFIDAAMWTTVPKRLRPWIESKLTGKRTP